LNGKRQGKDEETKIAAQCLFGIGCLFFYSMFDVGCSSLFCPVPMLQRGNKKKQDGGRVAWTNLFVRA